MAYPLLAAKGSQYVDRIFVSTNAQDIMNVGREYGAEIIVRPPELCTKQALGEEAFVHGYRVIRDQLAANDEFLELVVLLFANAATISSIWSSLSSTGICQPSSNAMELGPTKS